MAVSPSEAAPARGLRHAFRALHQRDFAVFFAGAFISNIGMWMQNVTVPFVLNEATGSAAWIGLGGFAQFLPAMLIGPLGGVLADRLPRRRLLMVSQTGSMLVALTLWASVRGGHIQPGMIVGLVTVAGLCSGIGIPAWQSLVPELVPRHLVLNAVALNSAQFNATRALGFLAGGVALSEFGPASAFLANAGSYLAVLGALAVVRGGRVAVSDGQPRQAGAFRQAVRYTRERVGLRLAVLTVGMVAFLGSPVVLFTAVFAKEEYGVGQRAYGFLAAAFGIGATVGSVVLSAYGDGFRRSRLIVGAVAVYGGAVLAMGMLPWYLGGVAALFAVGVGYVVTISALNTSIQLTVDPRFRGRVLSLYFMAFTGGYPIGALIQGSLAEVVGVRAVVAAAGLALLGYAAYLAARPVLAASLDDAVLT